MLTSTASPGQAQYFQNNTCQHQPAVYGDTFSSTLANNILQVPSNIILKRVAPSTWLAAIMFLWGVATVGQGLVQNQPGLIAMRLLLGLFEAGFFPGT
jgi:MFS family permease